LGFPKREIGWKKKPFLKRAHRPNTEFYSTPMGNNEKDFPLKKPVVPIPNKSRVKKTV